MLQKLKRDLNNLKNNEKSIILSGFFKTGKGQYGEGDSFLGISVPDQRKIAKKYLSLKLEDIQNLLEANIHEYRLTALLILVEKFKKSFLKNFSQEDSEEIISFYLKNTKKVNNWDLVDLTAPNILGAYLLNKNRDILYTLAKSDNLWEKRIAVISTFVFIKNNDFKDTLEISKILLKDKHDLIHKAVGWMLREVGKKSLKTETDFLSKNYKEMPRTTLRYAIEKFPEKQRKFYLNAKIDIFK
ncbi:MAG: DNA alkylation repair protein [Nanoarchaeota archaeon]